MWHIISGDKTPVKYLVIHETKDRTDYLLRASNGECWVSDLIYDIIDKDDFPEMLDHFLEHNDYHILYSFESDTPLTYLQNLPLTHPEFFI